MCDEMSEKSFQCSQKKKINKYLASENYVIYIQRQNNAVWPSNKNIWHQRTMLFILRHNNVVWLFNKNIWHQRTILFTYRDRIMSFGHLTKMEPAMLPQGAYTCRRKWVTEHKEDQKQIDHPLKQHRLTVSRATHLAQGYKLKLSTMPCLNQCREQMSSSVGLVVDIQVRTNWWKVYQVSLASAHKYATFSVF